MYHRKAIAPDIAAAAFSVQADLADPRHCPPSSAASTSSSTLRRVLFAPCPERFLPETNTRWF
jgi:hypothetical protein